MLLLIRYRVTVKVYQSDLIRWVRCIFDVALVYLKCILEDHKAAETVSLQTRTSTSTWSY